MTRSFMILFASAVLIPSVGCMTSPVNRSEIPGRVTRFEGFEMEPGMEVKIQAWNVLEGRWETIATAESREDYRWEFPLIDPDRGTRFFRWETRWTYIRPQYWRAGPAGDRMLSCEIRGIREDGSLVKTYNSTPDWSDIGALADFGINGNPDDVITLRSR